MIDEIRKDGGEREHAAAMLEQAIVLLRSAGKLLSGQSEASTESTIQEQRTGTAEETATIAVYWAGCGGLATLARRLGTRVDKIGTSTEADLADRLHVIGRDEYGACTRDANGTLVKESGFGRWVAQAIGVTRIPTDQAITVRTRTIEVSLPMGLSRRAFDCALQEGLAEWALEVRHAGVQRLTAYSIGTTRLSRAGELYAGLDPRRDGDRLLTIIETIISRHRARGVAAAKGKPAAVREVTPSEGLHPTKKPRRSTATPALSMSAASRRAMLARLSVEASARGRRSGRP